MKTLFERKKFLRSTSRWQQLKTNENLVYVISMMLTSFYEKWRAVKAIWEQTITIKTIVQKALKGYENEIAIKSLYHRLQENAKL